MKRVAIYTRVSSNDQHTETQLCDLRPLAKARGFEIVGEYTDTISGAKAKRPGLDRLMADARRGRFDGVLLWSFDRMARSVKHFLGSIGRTQSPAHWTRQFPRKHRHFRPVGSRHDRHCRCDQ
jgi:predicted site-specific integrase-resolvase